MTDNRFAKIIQLPPREKEPEMSSADCKDEIVRMIPGTKVADWKRTSKKIIDGHEIRWFENKATGAQVIVDTEDDCPTIYELGPNSPMLFVLADAHEMDPDMSEPGEIACMFAPKDFWDRNHCIPDWHMTWFLEKVLNVPAGWLDEACENQFIIYDETLDSARAKLEALGFVYEADVANAGQ